MINPAETPPDGHTPDLTITRHHVSYLAVFGSATTARFRQDSDLDFLVSFEADLSASQIADAFFDLKLELEALFNRPVDLITKASLTNPYFRQSVMAGQRALYAA
ncbi:MAG TPA: hypothetical protein DHU56_10410 [Marinobacter sp.]|nr:hypothetical protein [Marinobacter sp.]